MEKIDFESLKALFDRDGYVFIPGFLTAQEVGELNEKLVGFIGQTVPSMPSGEVFYEDKSDASTLKQLINLNCYDPYFEKVLKGSRFEELATGLLGEMVIPKTLEYFNKPPKIGKPTPPHQDAYYFNMNPPQAATMWLALEEVDEENGCVRYVRGSHQLGMRPHCRTSVAGFSQGISDFGTELDRRNERPYPAKAGDLLVHHAMTIHRAEGNANPTRSRRAMGLIYFGESAQEDVAAREAYQRQLQRETVKV